MTETDLDPALVSAYRLARYCLQGIDWQLQIGLPQIALSPHYQRHGVQYAAFLTACNPLRSFTAR